MNCTIETYTLRGGRTRRKLVFEDTAYALFTEFFAAEPKRVLRELAAELDNGNSAQEFAGNLFECVIADGIVKIGTSSDETQKRTAEMPLADFADCLKLLLG